MNLSGNPEALLQGTLEGTTKLETGALHSQGILKPLSNACFGFPEPPPRDPRGA